MGRRLEFSLKQLERSEDDQGLERGAAGLPDDDWRRQAALYFDALTRLLTEQRRMMALAGKIAGELDPAEEGSELEAAAELLTDEEWARVAARRAKDGVPR